MEDHLESALLLGASFRHGFFTRRLDFGDAARRDQNRARAAEVLGVSPKKLYWLSQVHGVEARAFQGEEDPDEVLRSVGDVTFAVAEGVGAGVRVADCVPILVGDRTTGFACAIHSGWRGTAQDVAGAALRAFAEAGAKGDLVAAIGPHIEACCFEVGDDVARELAKASSLGERAVKRDRERPHVDLRAIVRAQLEAAGVAPSQIDDVRGCTVCDARFHSHRRDKSKAGRMLAAIAAHAPK